MDMFVPDSAIVNGSISPCFGFVLFCCILNHDLGWPVEDFERPGLDKTQ